MKKNYTRTDDIEKLIVFLIQNTEEKEDWREIEKADGKYFVSTFGRVISLYKSKAHFRQIDTHGDYYRVKISINNQLTNKSVSRLVAQTFIGDCSGKEVHHKDFNSKNNNVDNLQILTPEEHRAIHAKHNQQKREAKENETA